MRLSINFIDMQHMPSVHALRNKEGNLNQSVKPYPCQIQSIHENANAMATTVLPKENN